MDERRERSPGAAWGGRGRLGVAVALVALCAGCGDRSKDLLIGRDARTAGAGNARGAGMGSFGNAGGAGARPSATPVGRVAAEIRDREGVTLDLVTVGCSGECFDVEAVARGGYPPYTYRWEDGSTEPVRQLCPEASQTFGVDATDSGFHSEEFTREPETAKAEVTAEVLACPVDSGMPPPLPDAGEPTQPPPPMKWEPLCIPNGSFEDMSGTPWHYCPPEAADTPLDIVTPWAGFGYPAVINGSRYLRLEPTPSEPVTISAPFCGPVTTGVGYYHQIASMRSESAGIRLQLYFANDDCALEEKLFEWDLHTAWVDACWNWPAVSDAKFIVIRAVATGTTAGAAYLDSMVIDHMRCPPPN